MPQHDYVISDQSGLSFLSDLNNALAAVVTQNSGPTEPSPTYAYQRWPDTTTGLMKIRNASNTAWVALYRLDGTFSAMPPADGSVTTARLADGALAASAAGLLKMSDGYLAASAAGRAKMADGFTTTPKLADDAVTPAKLAQPLTLASSVSPTSGAAIDFTGIPSWVKRITVMFSGLSTNGASTIQLQLGTSAGFQVTGYSGASSNEGIGTFQVGSYAGSGFEISDTNAASAVFTGIATLAAITPTRWCCTGLMGRTDLAGQHKTAGSKDVAGTLDRLRITANGTDQFDAGTINILYEG